MINSTPFGVPQNEFNHFISQYAGAKYFATIKVGGECLNQDLTNSVKSLYTLGLLPILVHGGGKQIDEALKQQGLVSEKIEGIRVTDKKTLDVVVSTLSDLNASLVSALNNQGTCAKGLNRFFYVDGTHERYGFSGNVVGINESELDECLRQKQVPIISSLGIDKDQNYSNLNADSAFKFLVSKISPKKVVFLTPTGGVYRGTELISYMRRKELKEFIESEFVSGGMKLKLKEADELVGLGHDVQIASPTKLIGELFSFDGSGTYLCNK